MIRHRYYIGEEAASEQTWPAIEALCVETYGGFTQYRTMGAWRDESGHVIHESSRVYECCLLVPRPDILREKMARSMATLARQECVLWTEEEIQGGFEGVEPCET